LRLARLTRDEAALAAQVHRAAFDERLPWISGLHTPEEDTGYWRDHVFADCQVWGAWDGEALAGVIAFREGWVEQLYILPAFQGRGAGRSLLEIGMQGQASVRLWTFQKNTGARRFYERNGFAAIELTDGARNEEREPDVLYEWLRAGAPGETIEPKGAGS
jgi:GNAT superfamily N-acetyltransferase